MEQETVVAFDHDEELGFECGFTLTVDQSEKAIKQLRQIDLIIGPHVSSPEFIELFGEPEKIRVHTKISERDKRYAKKQRFIADVFRKNCGVVCVLIVCNSSEHTLPHNWYIVQVPVYPKRRD